MDYEKRITELRRDLISEIKGLLHTKGYYDTETRAYRLPLYDEEYPVFSTTIDGRGNYENSPVEYVHLDRSNVLWIETEEAMNPATEIYADDLFNIQAKIAVMSDEDIRNAEESLRV